MQSTPMVRADGPIAATPIVEDVACLRTAIANVYFVGAPHAADRAWTLVDAGVVGFAGTIHRAAADRFGADARPSAIVLTHGHFDHVGSLRELADAWDAPVYAHPLEAPYLTGRASYPPPDPAVGGGLLSWLSWLYPRGPIDVGDRLRILPEDGAVPGLPEWRWLPTPGHSPGHVSFFRERDAFLLAGDAVTTVKQESALAVIEQAPELHGPPAYFTTDWREAGQSVRILAGLRPATLATGHGVPLHGPAMRADLVALAREFERIAVPREGRYVRRPAVSGVYGPVKVPPPLHTGRRIAYGVGAAIALGLAIGSLSRPRSR